MPNDSQNLETLSQLSHAFGTKEYVLGGGGNTSYKNDKTMWIKPSGTVLSELTPDRFVAMDRAAIQQVFIASFPTDVNEREKWIVQQMASAVRPDSKGRPSVETPLHEAYQSRFVVHTHATLINGLTCSKDGEKHAKTLFPDALWVPYIDPGLMLSLDVSKRLAAYHEANGHDPAIVLLENHGVFVAGDDAQAITATYEHVIATLQKAYEKANISTTLTLSEEPTPDRVRAIIAKAHHLLGSQGQGVSIRGKFEVANGPLTPDHIVYSKSYPLVGEPNEEKVAEYREKFGYAPRVLVLDDAIVGVGPSNKAADLAVSFAIDGAHVQQLAQAFGGVQWLTDAHRLFIENWEAESYRSQVSGAA